MLKDASDIAIHETTVAEILTPSNFAGHTQNDTHSVFLLSCGWCSCHSSISVHGSISHNSFWAYSCESPIGVQPHQDLSVWIPIHHPSKRWNPGMICLWVAPAEIATAELGPTLWNMAHHLLELILMLLIIIHAKVKKSHFSVKSNI